MFLTVIIASKGRPAILAETIRNLHGQIQPADEVIVSVTGREDLPAQMPVNVRILTGPPGSSRQRNLAVVEASPASDVMVFMDDDIALAPDYFAKVREVFQTMPDVVAFSPTVLHDGDISRKEAEKIVSSLPPVAIEYRDIRGIYGAINVRSAIARQVTFDERLALYGWLEDADWAARCQAFGRIGAVASCRLVHLKAGGSEGGGARFGFSQIMNPTYLWRKGSITSFGEVLRNHWLPCVVGNLLRIHRPPRRKRLKGNLIALAKIIRGRVVPEDVAKVRP
ncbi:MAG: glycosyltransferase family 2 protein [Gemmataceae bacterium]